MNIKNNFWQNTSLQQILLVFSYKVIRVHPKMSQRHCDSALMDWCVGAEEVISSLKLEIALSLVPRSAQ